MEGNQIIDADLEAVLSDTEFKPARFPAELGLPPADETLLLDAQMPVRQEYRDCSKWKRLRCRKVSLFAERDRSKRILIDPEVRVVVATAFKAMSCLKDNTITKMLEDGDAQFTTIFIDEAGLMPRAAIAALSLLAAKRVVLVGDSKQLAPISRISRILPTREQTWLASSGLSHLDDLESTPKAVHVLSEQRRMHPDVCQVVSDFQYGGFLKTAEETSQRHSQLPPFLAEYSRTIWYVLDEEGTDLAAIRAERGPGNKSWVRSITPTILQKFFTDSAVTQSAGLFISPYKAQAQAISKLLAKWGLMNWEASTVHSSAGSQTPSRPDLRNWPARSGSRHRCFRHC